MKALVKSKSKRDLWLQIVLEPQIGANDVLIHVDDTGICGMDVHIYKLDGWTKKLFRCRWLSDTSLLANWPSPPLLK